MPLIELTLPTTSHDGGNVDQLVSDLTDIILTCEGVQVDNVDARRLTWCLVNTADATYLAGNRETSERYVLRVTLPEGILSPDARTRLIRESTEAIADFDGRPDAPGRTACPIVEIPDGRIGWSGEAVTRSSLRELTSGAPARSPQESSLNHDEGAATPPADAQR